MQTQDLKQWQHKHEFSVIQEHGEKRTLQVLLLTAVTMIVEIIILLDGSIEEEILQKIVQAMEADKDNRVSDIHVWKVGPNHYATMISIVTHHPQSPVR